MMSNRLIFNLCKNKTVLHLAHKRVKTNHDIRRMIKQTEQLYESLMRK